MYLKPMHSAVATRTRSLTRVCEGHPPHLPLRTSPRRLAAVALRASKEDGPSNSAAEEEQRLEAIEASIRRKPARQIPIRGMTQQKEENTSSMAPWKEGQLFPEGWEQMDAGTKMTEMWMGQRGFLFWANKIAYATALGTLFAWVVFRFVGPNIGLYKLAGDVLPPTF